MFSKIIDRNEAAKKIESVREVHKQIVFTNGCFDILHAGHVRYLTAARKEGDVLVVGLNSDQSVRKIKGDKRPVIPQDERSEILAGLWCVDYIIVFNEPDPLNLIELVRPDVLVKGDDWPEDKIIGADFVKEKGGRVVRVPLLPGASTSQIIERIIEVYG